MAMDAPTTAATPSSASSAAAASADATTRTSDADAKPPQGASSQGEAANQAADTSNQNADVQGQTNDADAPVTTEAEGSEADTRDVDTDGTSTETQPSGGASSEAGADDAASALPDAGVGSAPDAASAEGGEAERSEPDTNGGNIELDPFGIAELYPSLPGGASWSSEHWSGGSAYSIDERQDPNDPSGLSGMRGTGTVDVTGDGELVFGGSQPRIYVYPKDTAPWTNVEITAYYQRVTDDETAWGGLVIGARSGVEGHGTEPCDAHTYYARLRHDGATDFEKELMHTPSSTRSRVEPEQVWPPDGLLPRQIWIGFKFVIYNLPDDASVKLESYRDMTQGADGGTWELLNEAIDAGDWPTQTTCEEHAPIDGEATLVQLDGGVCFIRNTGVTESRYRWVSIREIAP
jgi:hypothetical protein